MSDIHKAEKFLTDYGPDLEELLADVEEVCRKVQKRMEIGAIDDIYDRKQSSGEKSNFKEPGKIIIKLREQGKNPNIHTFLELNDIVGLTVVTRYPAQVKPVIAEIRSALRSLNGSSSIETEEPEPKNRDGYYATHLTCRRHKAGHEFQCEIQVKTMLHNAMSAKMHDLTYKPTGMLDPRLKALMASIAATIESLEQQSQLVHDSIKANWNVEEETRQAARDELFDGMLKYLWRSQSDTVVAELQAAVVDLQKKVKEANAPSTGALADTSASIDKPTKSISELTKRINQCCAGGPEKLRHGWIIAARLASLFPKGDLVRFAMGHMEEWLAIAPRLLAENKIEEKEITAVPLVFYVFGDLERAIDYCDRLVGEPALSPTARARLKFNKATFQIEREYHAPTKHSPSRNSLRAELEKVLDSDEIIALDSKAAILDTKGLLKVTFARNAEEVRVGINECFDAYALASEDEKKISKAYTDANLRLGWRRYVQLEGQKVALD